MTTGTFEPLTADTFRNELERQLWAIWRRTSSIHTGQGVHSATSVHPHCNGCRHFAATALAELTNPA